MFDVSTIDINALPRLPLARRKELPSQGGVYLAMGGDEVLYVGRSQSLVERWRSHHRIEQLQEIPDVLIAWLVTDNWSERQQIEKHLIRRFGPFLNKTAQVAQNGTVVLPARVASELKERIAEESVLRGHTVSEAVEQMIRFGMPLYLKQVPKQFKRVESTA